MNQQSTDDLKKYRMFGLTLLQLMSVIALGGVVLTIVMRYLL